MSAVPMSQDPAHNWKAADGGKRALGKHAGFTGPHHEHLSFDGCGINGRDEYRSRLCTFTEARGKDAYAYGPMFAAAPEMLEALKESLALLEYMAGDRESAKNHKTLRRARDAIARAEGRAT